MMSCSLFSKWFSKNSAYIVDIYYYHIALYYKLEIVVNHCRVFFFFSNSSFCSFFFLFYSFLLAILDCDVRYMVIHCTLSAFLYV